MRPSQVILSSWENSDSSSDAAARVARWYGYQAAQLFGGNSRLARSARGLQNITLFMTGPHNAKLEIEHLKNFSTMCPKTFPNLKKISYCFSAVSSKIEWHKEYINSSILLLMLKTSPPGSFNLNYKQHPWKRISYGCQYEVSGVSLPTEDGREIELEFVLYYS